MESDPRTLTPISDLGRGGVFVHTDQLFAVGARILIRFVLFPEAPRVFEHTGRVVRHSRDPRGMGVAFDPLTPELEALVDVVLAADEARPRRDTLGQRHVIRATTLRARVLGRARPTPPPRA
jgi:hypothetical protein